MSIAEEETYQTGVDKMLIVNKTEDQTVETFEQDIGYKHERRFSTFTANPNQVYYTWQNINFSVPLKREDKLALELANNRGDDEPEMTKDEMRKLSPYDLKLAILKKQANVKVNLDKQDSSLKQILHNQTGYAKPGEMVAIMGASGSGKTSLLNILGDRLDVSSQAKVNVDIRCNNVPLKKGDFGKIGAFVMQDDILIETMTPFESFVFAAKLRTSLSKERIFMKAEDMIDRLQLHSCKHSKIGGFTLKSISGGERKRTCIGYELITDPNLLLLDEPTSGLDSSTALRIVQLLKREAKNGMTIIATIHQPSGEVFNCFDRLIVLQDGYTVYQGPLNELGQYFQ